MCVCASHMSMLLFLVRCCMNLIKLKLKFDEFVPSHYLPLPILDVCVFLEVPTSLSDLTKYSHVTCQKLDKDLPVRSAHNSHVMWLMCKKAPWLNRPSPALNQIRHPFWTIYWSGILPSSYLHQGSNPPPLPSNMLNGVSLSLVSFWGIKSAIPFLEQYDVKWDMTDITFKFIFVRD